MPESFALEDAVSALGRLLGDAEPLGHEIQSRSSSVPRELLCVVVKRRYQSVCPLQEFPLEGRVGNGLYLFSGLPCRLCIELRRERL